MHESLDEIMSDFRFIDADPPEENEHYLQIPNPASETQLRPALPSPVHLPMLEHPTMIMPPLLLPPMIEPPLTVNPMLLTRPLEGPPMFEPPMIGPDPIAMSPGLPLPALIAFTEAQNLSSHTILPVIGPVIAIAMPAAPMPNYLPPHIPYQHHERRYRKVVPCKRSPNHAQAVTFLTSLIAVTEPLMARDSAPHRDYRVNALIEMDPARNPEHLWGFINVRSGIVIILLRDAAGAFYPFESVLSSLFHELAHIYQGRLPLGVDPHNDIFQDECIALKYEYNKM